MSKDIGVVPEGWAVLYCEQCPASLCWTADDSPTYGGEWLAAVRWASEQVEHGPHEAVWPTR